MKEKVNSIVPIAAAVHKALEWAEATHEDLKGKVESLFTEAERIVAPHRSQAGETTLIVRNCTNCNASLEFALLGDFSDLDASFRNAGYASLREDICGGELDREILDTWLTSDASEIVLDLGSRADHMAAEETELEKLICDLKVLESRLDCWDARIQDRFEGFDPDNL